MLDLVIKDPTAFSKTLSTPRMRLDAKEGAPLIDGEPQETGRTGIRGYPLCSETALSTGVWGVNDTSDPVFEFDDDPRLMCDGAETPYPLPEGKKPFVRITVFMEGTGFVMLSGTSFSILKGIKKICSSYWNNGCSTFALCWFDITPAVKSKHKNFNLTFRPIEQVPVERFSQFAPHAAALKAAFAPPVSAPVAKLTASEIAGDSVDDVSPVPKVDALIGKIKPLKRPAADSRPDDGLDDLPW